MKQIVRLCVAGLASLLSTSVAFAQLPMTKSVAVRIYDALGVEVPGTAQNITVDNSDILIDFGATPVTALRTIRIYDTGYQGESSYPTMSIGRLVIKGQATPSARINILIADRFQHTTAGSRFPTVLQAPVLLPGLVSFGGNSIGLDSGSTEGQAHDYDSRPLAGPTVGNMPTASVVFTGYDTDLDPSNGYDIRASLVGIIIPDPSLRRQTVLAAVASTDICPGFEAFNEKLGQSRQPAGRIEVGQVLRLAATGVTQTDGSFVGGNINACIVADSMDKFLSYDLCGTVLPTDSHAIESIAAGKSIHGSITAFGRARDDVAWDSPVLSTQGRLFERAPAHDTDPPTTPVFDSGEPVHYCGSVQIPWSNYPAWIDRGSIFSVRLGPIDTAKGIYGDIVATYGRIYSIRSTGEIVGGQITAADGVLEVRIHNWGASSDAAKTPLAKDLAVATITANSNDGVQKVGSDSGDDYATTIAKASNQGCIHLIETKGRFSGNVICQNLMDAGDGTQRDALGRSGVIVWDCDAVTGLPLVHTFEYQVPAPEVNVKHLAHNVSILAPKFRHISIGWQLKGTIDAFGSKAFPQGETGTDESASALTGGTIDAMEIGNLASESSAESNDKYHGMVPGFVGGYRPPVDLNPHTAASAGDVTPPPYVFDPRFPDYINASGAHNSAGGQPVILHVHPMLWDPDRYLWVQPLHGTGYPTQYNLDEGALDSVIRAENGLGTKSQIFALHQRIFENEEPKNTTVSWYRPRVEAPTLQQLGIPDIHTLSRLAKFYHYAGVFEGVVWSGRVEYLPFAPYSSWDWHGSVRKWYPDIKNSALVQRVGPGGDVWGRGLALVVARDMCGELHSTSIDGTTDTPGPSHGIDIGSRLGDLTNWPYPSYTNAHDVNGSVDPSRPAFERTPRDRARIGPSEFEADIAPRGGVYVGLFEDNISDTNSIDPAGYPSVPRLEQTSGVMVNTSYTIDHGNELSLWDPLDPDAPVYNSYPDAWTGFVRVGDPWIDSARTPPNVYTLGRSGAIGTTPLPNATLDVMDLLGHINQYQRHSWELSGFQDREPNRMGGAVGVAPYFLHPEDTSPPLDNPAAPTLPASYHELPVWQWVHNWPPINTTIGGPIDPVFGAEGVPRVRFRFYGPINDSYPSPIADVPVRIERWIGGVWQWFDPADPKFFFEYDDTARSMNDPTHTLNSLPYDLYLGPKCFAPVLNGTYKITLHPQTTPTGETTPNNRLVCSTFAFGDLSIEPQPFTWYVRLYSDCPDVGMSGGFVGSDGMLDNNDFIAFITLFFAQDGRVDFGSAGGVLGSDGLFDNNDWIAFIDRFFYYGDIAHADEFAQHCETINTRCYGELPPPGIAGRGSGGEGGGEGNRMMGDAGGEGTGGDLVSDIRAMLQLMIDNETDPARRDQLQQMLNTLPPVP